MSQSQFEITINYTERSRVKDDLERLTAAELTITAGVHNMTRVWDHYAHKERPSIYVPLFAIAEWIVANWWAILDEPCRLKQPPTGGAVLNNLDWVNRHNLQAADSALSLPFLYIFSTGSGNCFQWGLDNNRQRTTLGIRFLEEGCHFASRDATSALLYDVVENVLSRVSGEKSDRVTQLTENWEAIKSAGSEEESFCKIAGRMGLNPYDSEDINEDVENAILSINDDADLPLVRDLTEVATPDLVAQDWKWIQAASNDLNLHAISDHVAQRLSIPANDGRIMPYQYGYEVARFVRHQHGVAESAILSSIEEIFPAVTGLPLIVESRNHLSDEAIYGIVGWTGDAAIISGPAKLRRDSSRFFAACGFYHALCSCLRSQRVITKAQTWDQRASRGFAAEFLAPQQALTSRVGVKASTSQIHELAEEFEVSSRLILNQLSNAGVEVDEDY